MINILWSEFVFVFLTVQEKNVLSFIFCFRCSPVSEVKTETEVRKSPTVYLECFMLFMIILLKKGLYGNAFTLCNVT